MTLAASHRNPRTRSPATEPGGVSSAGRSRGRWRSRRLGRGLSVRRRHATRRRGLLADQAPPLRGHRGARGLRRGHRRPGGDRRAHRPAGVCHFRACDLAARGLLKARASAVFAPPAIVGAAAMVPAAAIATTTRPQGAQPMAQCPALSSSATIVAASAIRWSLAQGGPIAARGPSRISSARSASLLTARASTSLAS